jgi:hypothetical protein
MTEITRTTKLTTELIQEFKDVYKKIFKTVMLDGSPIIWRRLSRAEYKQIMAKSESVADTSDRLWMREEDMCRQAVLYPCLEELEEIMAENCGIASIVSDEIMEKSGFRVKSRTEEL